MLQVTCALIVQDGMLLCAQRSESMSLPMKWEFPGGKLEAEESAEDCIRREIREELGVEIEVLSEAPSSLSRMPEGGHLELIPFLCRITKGEPKALEHAQIRWCSPEEVSQLDWAVADVAIVDWWIAHSRTRTKQAS